jgi:phosphate starvation-inducible protein PhoH and related proteins
VTGDITQTDLSRGKESGLNQVGRILDGVPGIAFIHFDAEDVVRHPLVQRIVAAYGREEAGQRERKPRRAEGPETE